MKKIVCGWRLRPRLLAFLLTGLGAAQAAEAPPMELQQVSPSAWYVQGVSELGSSANQNFISNAGVV
ncbi:MAG TPA: hypothetical protein VFX90_10035, partial [Rhodoferax sp.]|nr:hypothetical protein [Rhodoferax sp.]